MAWKKAWSPASFLSGQAAILNMDIWPYGSLIPVWECRKAGWQSFGNPSTGPYTTKPDALADLEDLDSQNHESIGILNVNSRMVLYYGTDYTLLIDSEEGVGTNIQIPGLYRLKSDTNALAAQNTNSKGENHVPVNCD